MDSISTHRLSTANPRRTRIDSLPGPRTAQSAEDRRIPEPGPTANPRRTTLVEQQD